MTIERIPAPIIAVVAQALSEHYYSHGKLDRLFCEAGAPGVPPPGNCEEKCRAWLRRVNADAEADPLAVLAAVLVPLMETGAGARGDISPSAVEERRRRVREVLARHGLAYDEGMIVRVAKPADGPQEPEASTPFGPAGDFDRHCMTMAIEASRSCRPERDDPTPMVGVVVAKLGVILTQAYRGELTPGDHAEFTALEKKLAERTVAGATVYTTLEPCTTRRHPKVPCAERLVERKVARVVIGMVDPNPNIRGKGLRMLREHNIDTVLFPGDLAAQVEELNRHFTRHVETGTETARSDAALQLIIARARQHALKAFSEERLRIEREQAAKGVLGGPVLTRCRTAAETVIQAFATQVVPESLGLLDHMSAGPPSPEALEWVRTTVRAHIDTLVAELGGQIDALKTIGRVKGAAEALQPARTAAKRDLETELSKRNTWARTVRPGFAPVSQPRAHVGPGRGMYSLLVSGNSSAWSGSPFLLDRDRFLEYTDEEVRHAVGDLSERAIMRLVRLPCIFAYEDRCTRDPVFGVVRQVVPRVRDVRIEYEMVHVERFLTQLQLHDLGPALGIQDFEFHRTHWAVKEADLRRLVLTLGIALPPAAVWRPPVDLSIQRFDVGLSFPGELRPFVKEVADQLEEQLGADRYFYDENYTAQLARPDLDLLLQDIYRKRSRLVVVFLSEAYERKEWCAGVEFRAIREIIKAREQARVMYVRMDDGAVNGVLSLDGAVDGRKYVADEIARMIRHRVELLP